MTSYLTLKRKRSIIKTRKRSNCEYIATGGRPIHSSPFRLNYELRRHAKFDVVEPVHCRIIVFCITLCCGPDFWLCDLDLWPTGLESSWYIKRRVSAVCTEFGRNQAISGWIIDNFANFCTCYVTLWSWSLTSWTWTELLRHFGCHAFKLCTRFERNRIIHGWVIDHIKHYTILLETEIAFNY